MKKLGKRSNVTANTVEAYSCNCSSFQCSCECRTGSSGQTTIMWTPQSNAQSSVSRNAQAGGWTPMMG